MMLSIQLPGVRLLNVGHKEKECCKTAVDASKDLQKLMLRLKSEYMSDDGQSVNYEALKKSKLFKEYEEQAAGLQAVDLGPLTEEQKMAFFINVYNALTIHGLVQQDKLPGSVLDVQQFWKTTAYNIGGHTYSLDDIEHGVLRGNRPHPSAKTGPFTAEDPRLKHIMKKVDPRLHFALVCGAKSCPAVQVYTAENLNKALDGATRSFCEQEVRVYEMRKEILVSPIFQWYVGDFGNDDVGALRWAANFLSEEKKRILDLLLYILEEKGMVDINYREYDWKLNKS